MVEGRFATGETAQLLEATLTLEGTSLIVRDRSGAILCRSPKNKVSLSSRLGKTPRTVTFHGDRPYPTFETDNHAGIEAIVTGQEGTRGFLHKLESNLGLAACATALTLGFAIWLAVYAVPAGAKLVALALPDAFLNNAGTHTLYLLDNTYFAPSELSSDDKARVRRMLAPHFEHQTQFLYFRSWIPNAFALPNGSIVVTDELIQLAENDEELIAIVYHELGHVAQRHLIRRTLQDSALLIGLFLLTGDLGGADFLSGITVTLADLAYSREFEREADIHALAGLIAAGISKHHYRNILLKLDAWYADNSDGIGNSLSPLKYLSTHPQTSERIEAIDAYQSTH
jgi:Zn-dependent protease with chaperone function